MITSVPFVDLRRQYESIKIEIDNSVKEVIDNSAFILSSYLQNFENSFSKFCNVKFGIGTKSGTSALFLALKALGIKEGDEVITTPFSFIASASAISHTGANPVFVDIDEKSYNIDVNKIKNAITKKTKAIIPVHLYGQCADMDIINEIAEKYNLFVVEDACQSHGAEYKGKKSSSLGDAAAFSFYPTKNLGCFGDGGFITTNNEELYKKINLLRDHGQSKKYEHKLIGYNDRLDSLQAAVLSVKLKYLNKWNELRRKNSRLYSENFSSIDIVTPVEMNYNKHVYNVYAVRVKNRDKLIGFFKSKNIGFTIHYPIPIPFQKAYKFLKIKKGSFPIAEKVSKEIIALPIFPELREEEIRYVVESVKEVF